eukprot:403361428
MQQIHQLSDNGTLNMQNQRQSRQQTPKTTTNQTQSSSKKRVVFKTSDSQKNLMIDNPEDYDSMQDFQNFSDLKSNSQCTSQQKLRHNISSQYESTIKSSKSIQKSSNTSKIQNQSVHNERPKQSSVINYSLTQSSINGAQTPKNANQHQTAGGKRVNHQKPIQKDKIYQELEEFVKNGTILSPKTTKNKEVKSKLQNKSINNSLSQHQIQESFRSSTLSKINLGQKEKTKLTILQEQAKLGPQGHCKTPLSFVPNNVGMMMGGGETQHSPFIVSQQMRIRNKVEDYEGGANTVIISPVKRAGYSPQANQKGLKGSFRFSADNIHALYQKNSMKSGHFRKQSGDEDVTEILMFGVRDSSEPYNTNNPQGVLNQGDTDNDKQHEDSSFDSDNCNFVEDYIKEKSRVPLSPTHEARSKAQRDQIISFDNNSLNDIQLQEHFRTQAQSRLSQKAQTKSTSKPQNQKSQSKQNKLEITKKNQIRQSQGNSAQKQQKSKENVKNNKNRPSQLQLNTSRSSKRFSTTNNNQNLYSTASDHSQEDHIEQIFCKKYSRVKANKDVFERQHFETYQRQTKDNRINVLRESLSPKKTISPKQKEKCFFRLSRDAERRESQIRVKNHMNSLMSPQRPSANIPNRFTDKSFSKSEAYNTLNNSTTKSARSNGSKTRERRLSLKKLKQFNKRMDNFQNKKVEKIKKIQEDTKLKELEDYFGKYQQDKIQKCLQKEVLSEEERQRIFERQWRDQERRSQKRQKANEMKQQEESMMLSQFFKPRIEKSEQSFYRVYKGRSTSRLNQQQQNENGQDGNMQMIYLDQIDEKQVNKRDSSNCFNRISAQNQNSVGKHQNPKTPATQFFDQASSIRMSMDNEQAAFNSNHQFLYQSQDCTIAHNNQPQLDISINSMNHQNMYQTYSNQKNQQMMETPLISYEHIKRPMLVQQDTERTTSNLEQLLNNKNGTQNTTLDDIPLRTVNHLNSIEESLELQQNQKVQQFHEQDTGKQITQKQRDNYPQKSSQQQQQKQVVQQNLVNAKSPKNLNKTLQQSQKHTLNSTKAIENQTNTSIKEQSSLNRKEANLVSQKTLKKKDSTMNQNQTSSTSQHQINIGNSTFNPNKPSLVDKIIDQRISKVSQKLDQVIQEISKKKSDMNLIIGQNGTPTNQMQQLVIDCEYPSSKLDHHYNMPLQQLTSPVNYDETIQSSKNYAETQQDDEMIYHTHISQAQLQSMDQQNQLSEEKHQNNSQFNDLEEINDDEEELYEDQESHTSQTQPLVYDIVPHQQYKNDLPLVLDSQEDEEFYDNQKNNDLQFDMFKNAVSLQAHSIVTLNSDIIISEYKTQTTPQNNLKQTGLKNMQNQQKQVVHSYKTSDSIGVESDCYQEFADTNNSQNSKRVQNKNTLKPQNPLQQSQKVKSGVKNTINIYQPVLRQKQQQLNVNGAVIKSPKHQQ